MLGKIAGRSAFWFAPTKEGSAWPDLALDAGLEVFAGRSLRVGSEMQG